MSILSDLLKIGNGVRSGISDVPSLVTNILELDVHGVITDSRKVIGDVGDVLTGTAGLGVELGPYPVKYMATIGKLADSPPLSAAQLVIEGQKKLTGSGDPEVGSGYWDSAKNLDKTVLTLIDAEVEADAWDGAASKRYDETNKEHRRHVSNVSAADLTIGKVLNREADQVARTREFLDSRSQELYDYGLATKAILAIPGANVAKVLTADILAASAAVAATTAQMATMVSDSIQNASEIRQASSHYEKAMEDTSGDGGACGAFVDPKDDQKDKLPTRLHPETKYIPRVEPPVYGPPANPLPVESEAPKNYDLPADLPRPHITPPAYTPGGRVK
ncbi:EspA/EspE family type VII secretion system effector [Mycolicibacterium wolinskyi]|uniref:EspA/EspE family type VII secretion system effector n=1 Tax=Mycolicibacterium wolinskyi TaxID=59750 RepID=UPI000ACF0A65|nr:EspA/EspE family type VII secretion system effector [Mycolicibacterium wolinskyi]